MITEKNAYRINKYFRKLKRCKKRFTGRLSDNKAGQLRKGMTALLVSTGHRDFLKEKYSSLYHKFHNKKHRYRMDCIIRHYSYAHWYMVSLGLIQDSLLSFHDIKVQVNKYRRRRREQRKRTKARRQKKYHGFNSKADLDDAAILAYMKGDPTYALNLGLVSKKEVKAEQATEHEKERKIEYREKHRRTGLAKLGDKKRYRFVGEFVRSGYKTTFHGDTLNTGDRYAPTLLLKNVVLKSSHQKATDHLWLNYTKGFRKLGQFKPGDKIAFNARVSTYYKGYGPIEDKTLDYSLSFPTKVERVKDIERKPVPVDDKNALIGYVMKRNESFYLANDRPFDDWYVNQYDKWAKANA